MPSLILAIILTAYWGRVVRLVYKIRRQTGKSANFTPPEPVGRLLRILWVPAIVFWIVHLYWTGLFPNLLPSLLRPVIDIGPFAWIFTVLGALCLAATLICWKKMGKSWRMGINPEEKTELIITGPYAWVRHPIYALSCLLMLCSAAAVPSIALLAIALLHISLLNWEASREERYLIRHHGPAYNRYRQNVGRFVPRSFSPYDSAKAIGT
jgi:protein-S-isoprenylcysteine O-methyltransferase Ste14